MNLRCDNCNIVFTKLEAGTFNTHDDDAHDRGLVPVTWIACPKCGQPDYLDDTEEDPTY